MDFLKSEVRETMQRSEYEELLKSYPNKCNSSSNLSQGLTSQGVAMDDFEENYSDDMVDGFGLVECENEDAETALIRKRSNAQRRSMLLSAIDIKSKKVDAPGQSNAKTADDASASKSCLLNMSLKKLSTQYVHCDPVHINKATSVLSILKLGGKSKPASIEFTGFKHLIMLLLVLGNLRLFYFDFKSYGFQNALARVGISRSDLLYATLICLVNMAYLPVAFGIEKMAANVALNAKSQAKLKKKIVMAPKSWWKVIAAIHLINGFTCLAMTSAICYIFVWSPAIGTLCEAVTIVTFLKLSSYCLAMRDLRAAFLGTNETGESYTIYGVDSYPHNVTLNSLLYFWLSPTLVYQPIYPRYVQRRWKVMFSHVCQVFSAVITIWLLTTEIASPILKTALEDWQAQDYGALLDGYLRLSMVNIVIWLLGFFLIFQSLLNLMAEITLFADRDFYQDWWNAGSVGAYWRQWNKPVSNYLRRHVYVPMRRRGYSSLVSSTTVFLISAFFHELLVGVPTHNFNGVAFFCMLAQVPLIKVTQPLEKMRGPSTTVGNCIFWLSIMLGQPTCVMIYYFSWQVRYGNGALA